MVILPSRVSIRATAIASCVSAAVSRSSRSLRGAAGWAVGRADWRDLRGEVRASWPLPVRAATSPAREPAARVWLARDAAVSAFAADLASSYLLGPVLPSASSLEWAAAYASRTVFGSRPRSAVVSPCSRAHVRTSVDLVVGTVRFLPGGTHSCPVRGDLRHLPFAREAVVCRGGGRVSTVAPASSACPVVARGAANRLPAGGGVPAVPRRRSAARCRGPGQSLRGCEAPALGCLPSIRSRDLVRGLTVVRSVSVPVKPALVAVQAGVGHPVYVVPQGVLSTSSSPVRPLVRRDSPSLCFWSALTVCPATAVPDPCPCPCCQPPLPVLLATLARAGGPLPMAGACCPMTIMVMSGCVRRRTKL